MSELPNKSAISIKAHLIPEQNKNLLDWINAAVDTSAKEKKIQITPDVGTEIQLVDLTFSENGGCVDMVVDVALNQKHINYILKSKVETIEPILLYLSDYSNEVNYKLTKNERSIILGSQYAPLIDSLFSDYTEEKINGVSFRCTENEESQVLSGDSHINVLNTFLDSGLSSAYLVTKFGSMYYASIIENVLYVEQKAKGMDYIISALCVSNRALEFLYEQLPENEDNKRAYDSACEHLRSVM